jgi:hypothetical protein
MRNIRLHGKGNTATVAIIALIAFFLFAYFSRMDVEIGREASLPEILPVQGAICNLAASTFVDLRIEPGIINGLRDSGQVKDLQYSALFYENPFPGESKLTSISNLAATNDIGLFDDIDAGSLSFAPGYGMGCLEGSEAACIVHDMCLEEHGLNVGDSAMINPLLLIWNNADIQDPVDLQPIEIQVIGSYASVDDVTPAVSMVFAPGFYEALAAANGQPAYYSSASFKVADPAELNSFKGYMRELSLLEAVPTAQSTHIGAALQVDDEIFIKTISSIREGIALFRGFLPLIMVLAAMIAFIASNIMMQGRQREYALMRSLGIGVARCRMTWPAENLVIATAGAIVGIIVASVVMDAQIEWGVGPTLALLYGSYYLGWFVAIWLIGRVSIMEVLTKG